MRSEADQVADTLQEIDRHCPNCDLLPEDHNFTNSSCRLRYKEPYWETDEKETWVVDVSFCRTRHKFNTITQQEEYDGPSLGEVLYKLEKALEGIPGISSVSTDNCINRQFR